MRPFAAATSHQAMMSQVLVAQARQLSSRVLRCGYTKIITWNIHSASATWGLHIQRPGAIFIIEKAMVDKNRPTPAQQRHFKLVQASQSLDQGHLDCRHQPFQYIWEV